MKSLFLIISLLIPFNAFAVNYALAWHFRMPVEREDNTLITLAEIATLKAYRYDCTNTTLMMERVIYINNQISISNFGGNELQYIIHNEPKMCMKATVIDTDGRESRESDLFIIYDKDTPKPTECVFAPP